MDWSRTVEPAQEPVSVPDAKLHCRALQDIPDEDGLIVTYIRAARQLAERYMGRGLLTQTWTLERDAFAREMWLPMAAPLQSVTSVKYYDTDGAQQTLATSFYRVDARTEPGRVVRLPEQTWPSVQCERGQAVAITYVCGWTSVGAIPDAVKVGVLMLVDHLYENRSAASVGVGISAAVVPFGVAAFLDPYVVYHRMQECA
jgi:uncharacterized phiE125 gp8 family phage protein